MNRQINDMVIGPVAGLATALMWLGLSSGSGLSVILYLFSAIPIMAAGLGWGVRASGIAVAVALVAIGLSAGTQFALLVLLTTALPAALSAYWVTLSRPADEVGGPEGKLAWFPLSDVLFRLCLMSSTAFIIIGIMVGYSADMIAPIIDELVNRLRQTDPNFAFSDEARVDLLGTLTGLIPFVQPFTWALVLLGNLYLAMKLTRSSGQLRRPQDDFPTGLRMPKAALIAIAIGLVLSMMSGALGHIGAAISGGVASGFTIAGFAFLHMNARGKSWKPLAMIMAYGGTFIALFPAFGLFLAGLFVTARNLPISNPPTKNND